MGKLGNVKSVNSKKINNISDACSICFKENIKIYREPYGLNHFRIVIDYDGRKKAGEEIYDVKSDANRLSKKIFDLYVNIATKILDR